jgi:hypothetical protein
VRRSSDTIMPLTAEEHYYNIRYTLNGNQFNRIGLLQMKLSLKQKEKIEMYKSSLQTLS